MTSPSPDLALCIITDNINARRSATMQPPLNEDEMADLILAAAMAVCKRIGDPAAMRTIAEVREIMAAKTEG